MFKVKPLVITFSLIMVIVATSVNAQDNRSQMLLASTGALAMQGVMVTAYSIATAADCYKKVYDDETTINLLETYIDLSKSAQDQLRTVLFSGILSKEDEAIMGGLTFTYGTLIAEAEAFIKLIQTGNPKYGFEYEKHKDKVWEMIDKIGALGG